MLLKKTSVKSYIVFFTSLSIYFYLFIVVFSTYIGANSLNLFRLGEGKLIKVLPEGWAFFTKSPRERICRLYEIEPKGQLKMISLKGLEPQYYWGLSRTNRMLSLENGNLLAELEERKDTIYKYDFKVNDNYSIENLVSTDTLTFNTLSSKHTQRMPKHILMVLQDPVLWSKKRRIAHPKINVTIFPIQIK